MSAVFLIFRRGLSFLFLVYNSVLVERDSCLHSSLVLLAQDVTPAVQQETNWVQDVVFSCTRSLGKKRNNGVADACSSGGDRQEDAAYNSRTSGTFPFSAGGGPPRNAYYSFLNYGYGSAAGGIFAHLWSWWTKRRQPDTRINPGKHVDGTKRMNVHLEREDNYNNIPEAGTNNHRHETELFLDRTDDEICSRWTRPGRRNSFRCLASALLPRSPASFSGGESDLDLIKGNDFRPQEKVRSWLVQEGHNRAAFYLKRADQLFSSANRQINGLDPRPAHPYFLIFNAQHQILAALELDRYSPMTWFQAARLTLGAVAMLAGDDTGVRSDMGHDQQGLNIEDSSPEDEEVAYQRMRELVDQKAEELPEGPLTFLKRAIEVSVMDPEALARAQAVRALKEHRQEHQELEVAYADNNIFKAENNKDPWRWSWYLIRRELEVSRNYLLDCLDRVDLERKISPQRHRFGHLLQTEITERLADKLGFLIETITILLNERAPRARFHEVLLQENKKVYVSEGGDPIPRREDAIEEHFLPYKKFKVYGDTEEESSVFGGLSADSYLSDALFLGDSSSSSTTTRRSSKKLKNINEVVQENEAVEVQKRTSSSTSTAQKEKNLSLKIFATPIRFSHILDDEESTPSVFSWTIPKKGKRGPLTIGMITNLMNIASTEYMRFVESESAGMLRDRLEHERLFLGREEEAKRQRRFEESTAGWDDPENENVERAVEAFRKDPRRWEKLEWDHLNNKFFEWQKTAFEDRETRGMKVWPALYGNPEWKEALARLEDEARAFAVTLLSGRADVEKKGVLDQGHFDAWVQVYPSVRNAGGRHAFHAHQNSLVSCVLYLSSDPYRTPLGLVDPRGGSVLRDYDTEGHLGHIDDGQNTKSEYDAWQPEAPFHHPFYVFPQAGDAVCFPSWLTHFVPTHLNSNVTRVVVALNFAVRKRVDLWHLAATSS